MPVMCDYCKKPIKPEIDELGRPTIYAMVDVERDLTFCPFPRGDVTEGQIPDESQSHHKRYADAGGIPVNVRMKKFRIETPGKILGLKYKPRFE